MLGKILLSFLLLSASTAAWAAQLTGDQIKAKLGGSSFAVKSTDGKFTGTARYGADGSVAVTGNFSSTMTSDSGTWRISGNQMCIKYKKLREGKETCITYDERTDGTFLSSTKAILTPSR